MSRRKHRSRAVLLCFLSGCLLIAGLVSVDLRLRPLVQSYGMMSARSSAMLAVHRGVERVLAEEAVSYASFVTVVRDDASGQITALETNVTAINRMKAAVSDAVMEELGLFEKQTVSIPLGNLLGGAFFTGRGPFLPITIHTAGTVIATLTGEFTEAGINQTNHTLYLDMQVMMTAALPMERVSVDITTRFPVCDTVIVGTVPQTVLQLGKNLAVAD